MPLMISTPKSRGATSKTPKPRPPHAWAAFTAAPSATARSGSNLPLCTLPGNISSSLSPTCMHKVSQAEVSRRVHTICTPSVGAMLRHCNHLLEEYVRQLLHTSRIMIVAVHQKPCSSETVHQAEATLMQKCFLSEEHIHMF